MFEKASRMKLRFETSKGVLNAEDLWNLPLTGRGVCLNGIAKAVNQKLKDDSEEDFVTQSTQPTSINKLRLDILKRIIEIRLKEQETAKKSKETKERNQQILSLIAEKKTEKLKSLSVEELEAQLK